MLKSKMTVVSSFECIWLHALLLCSSALLHKCFFVFLGAPLVKALPVNPTDPTVTGPDLFAKLVPMAAHEASSLYR